MASARDDILQRIRRGLGTGSPQAPARAQELDAYLRAHPRSAVPEFAGDLVARFRARADAQACSLERVATLGEVPAAVRRYLDAHHLATTGCMWPALAQLGWAAAGIDLQARAANGEDAIGVTGVFCAIAETGTLMVCSGEQTPSSVSLLPETHIAIVPIERIVAHMEDAWDLARRELGELPRAVNFISGPSRTADIEQTVVLGAHGPYRVHIVLVGGGVA